MSLWNFNYRNSRLALAGGLLVLAGGVLGSGCDGDALPYPTQEVFCEALAQVVCNSNVVTACYGSDQTSIGTDTNSCVTFRAQATICNPGGLPYHPEGAEVCLAKHQEIYADAQLSLDEVKGAAEACLPTFNRGNGQGSSCREDVDCDAASQLRCVVQPGGKGSCQIPEIINAGSLCGSNPAGQCAEGFYCDSGRHCVENQGVGMSCGAEQPCSALLRCNDVSEQCEQRASNSSECTANDECSGGFCLATTTAGEDGRCSSTYKLEFTATSCDEFRR